MKAKRRLKGLAARLVAWLALIFLIIGSLQTASAQDAFRFVVYADSRGNWNQGRRSTPRL